VYKALFTASWLALTLAAAFLWGRNNQCSSAHLQPDFAEIDMGPATTQISSRRTERVAYRLRPHKAASKVA